MTRPANKLSLILDTRWTPEEFGAWQDHVRGVLTKMATDSGLSSWPSSDRPLSLKDREAVKKLLPVVEYMDTREVSELSSLSKKLSDVAETRWKVNQEFNLALAGQVAQTRLMRLGFRMDGPPHPEIGDECVEADAAIMRREGSVQEASDASVNAEADEERLAWMAARAKVRSAVVGASLEELRALVESE